MGNILRNRRNRNFVDQGVIGRLPPIFTISYRDITIAGDTTAPENRENRQSEDQRQTDNSSGNIHKLEVKTTELKALVSEKDHDCKSDRQSSICSSDSAFSESTQKTHGSGTQRCGIEVMVDIHRKFLEENLNVDEILPNLSCILEKTIVKNIHRLTTSNPVKAVSGLINALKTCQDEGKWQLFLESLYAKEYSYIAQVLKGDIDPFNDEINKRLLSLFHSKIIDNVYVPDMVEILYEKQVIAQVDYEQIEREYKTGGQHRASFSLLLRISARHQNWYKLFIETLHECNMDYIVKEIEGTLDECVTPIKDMNQLGIPNASLQYQSDNQVPCKKLCSACCSRGPDGRVITEHDTLVKSVHTDSPVTNENQIRYLRQLVEIKQDELKTLKARLLVIEAEEDIYETISLKEEHGVNFDETYISTSEISDTCDCFKEKTRPTTSQEHTEEVFDEIAEDDIHIEDENGYIEPDMDSIIPSMANIVAVKVGKDITLQLQTLKDDIMKHVTKEIQSSKEYQIYADDHQHQTYSDNYQNTLIPIGSSEIELYDAGDPMRYLNRSSCSF